MRFNVTRTSTKYINEECKLPCKGAEVVKEYDEDMMIDPWFAITINTLEELIQFIRDNGDIVIESTQPELEFFETEGIVEEFIIEVYDSHRE